MSRTRGYAMDTGWALILEDAGISVPDLLRRAGLPEDFLTRSERFVAPAVFFGLIRALDEEVDDPTFPIRFTESITAEAFSPTLFAALCSPDLRTALSRISRYKQLMAPVRLDIDERPGSLTTTYVYLDPSIDPPPSFIGAELTFKVHVARMATRHRVEPLRVTSPVPLGADDAYTAWFGVPVERGERPSVTFSDADASRPFLTANPALWQTFEPTLQRRLAELDADATTVERVRGVLLEGLPSGRTSVEEVARRLAMSRRTLQRRLSEEGATFSDVLQGVREELARHYLTRTDLTASEIGFLLGFEETSSFFRAFAAWTGLTPEAARRELAS